MNIFKSEYFVGLWKLNANQEGPGFCLTLLIKGELHDTLPRKELDKAIIDAHDLVEKYT